MDESKGTSGGLMCMNCGQPAGQTGKLFAEVFVCSTCHMMAERLHAKAEKELRAILLVMREAIRIALVNKTLRFWSPGDVDKASSQDVLSRLSELAKQVPR